MMEEQLEELRGRFAGRENFRSRILYAGEVLWYVPFEDDVCAQIFRTRNSFLTRGVIPQGMCGRKTFKHATVILFVDEFIVATKDGNGALEVQRRYFFCSDWTCTRRDDSTIFIESGRQQIEIWFLFNSSLYCSLQRAIASTFEWNDKPCKCQLCRRYFSSFNARHTCKRCHGIVCNKCSTRRAELRNAPRRICNSCHIHYMNAKIEDRQAFESLKVHLIELFEGGSVCLHPILLQLVVEFLDTAGAYNPDALVPVFETSSNQRRFKKIV